jgi:hypothetical protein
MAGTSLSFFLPSSEVKKLKFAEKSLASLCMHAE